MNRAQLKRIGEIVKACKDHMCIEDMSSEFGISGAEIRRYCTAKNIQPISPKQVLINYLHYMKGKRSLEDIAVKTGYSMGHILNLISSEGERAEDYVVRTREKLTFNQMRMKAAILESVMERVSCNTKVPHIKDRYTQSGTPFGLADELRGIDRQP